MAGTAKSTNFEECASRIHDTYLHGIKTKKFKEDNQKWFLDPHIIPKIYRYPLFHVTFAAVFLYSTL